ncbi:MAG: beta-ketoacyl synthase N-terminal-like domain-containing protein, partial [bacterium]
MGFKKVGKGFLEKEQKPAAEKGRADRIEKELIAILSKILQIPVEQFDNKTGFSEYGLDSVSTMDFSDKIDKHFKIATDPTLLFEVPNIKALSEFVMKELKLPVEKDVPPEKKIFGEQKEAGFKPVKTDCVVNKEDIAIIGISGRFPGAKDLDEFWKNLEAGKDSIIEIPRERWRWEDYDGDPLGDENKTNSKWGGFLKDIREFDSAFFKISPREAELMDPQQRLLMEEVWHTIEDSGYKVSDLSGTKTGVFVGVCNADYGELLAENNIRLDSYTSTGSYFSIIPNRISFLLNIHGPSLAIDTACSSALIAINQAVESIRNNDSDLAIVGGTNIICHPRRYFSFSHAGMLSPDGRCKTFDKDANGYVRGEGIGAILLKPLEKAEADGDHIYAVIKATAVNHGGMATSLTAPNTNAQADLLIDAYDKAKLDPTKVSYIEAHGTGTSLGDPIEVNGLKKAFGELYRKWDKKIADKPTCGIGSVKTNIGHLESAAGIAGVLKVLLAMKHKKLPATINFKELNPYIQLENSPFYIVKETQDWNASPRIAGVSSFGFGGANAHVVIEEY